MTEEPIVDAVLSHRRLEALRLAKGRDATPKEIIAIGAQTDGEAASWAFTQWELRRLAERKFEQAAEMFFTRDALEMASHLDVARYHASQFPAGSFVADLTCGIGADLIALSERGPAVGFDIDFNHAAYAQHNVRVYGHSTLVRASDCICFQHLHHVPGQEHHNSTGIEYAFADPARRSGGRRHHALSDYEPKVAELAPWLQRLKLGGLKLSPMLPDTELESLGGRLEFVGHQWECKEALVWMGEGVEVERSAVHVESGERLPAGGTLAASDLPAALILEAHPAAIRAHALPSLGQTVGARALGSSNGFLTADELLESPWIRAFEVVAVCPARPKDVRQALQTHGRRANSVKPRAVEIVPEKWIRELRGLEGEPADVLVYPSSSGTRAVLARRLGQPGR